MNSGDLTEAAGIQTQDLTLCDMDFTYYTFYPKP